MPNHCFEYIRLTKLHYLQWLLMPTNLFWWLFQLLPPTKTLLRSRVCEVNTMVSGGTGTLRNTSKKSSLRSKYNGFRGDGGLSEMLVKSRVCEVNTMVSGPPMSLNSCSVYCCFPGHLCCFRACAMWRLCGDYAKEGERRGERDEGRGERGEGRE